MDDDDLAFVETASVPERTAELLPVIDGTVDEVIAKLMAASTVILYFQKKKTEINAIHAIVVFLSACRLVSAKAINDIESVRKTCRTKALIRHVVYFSKPSNPCV